MEDRAKQEEMLAICWEVSGNGNPTKTNSGLSGIQVCKQSTSISSVLTLVNSNYSRARAAIPGVPGFLMQTICLLPVPGL